MILERASVLALAIVAFIVATALKGVRRAPRRFNYTVERLGRHYKTLMRGLGLMLPGIDPIGRKLNVMEQGIDVPQQEIMIRENGVAFYQVLDVRGAPGSGASGPQTPPAGGAACWSG